MAEQTITTQPESATPPSKAKQPRQLVRFTFYKLDPQWQFLPGEICQQGKQELERIFEEYNERSLMRSYSLFGLRSDCDFMLWQATYSVEDLQGVSRWTRYWKLLVHRGTVNG
jgi:chlorite dismutase